MLDDKPVILYRLYQPSNSGDGEYFMADWCLNCANWGPVPYCPDMNGCVLDIDRLAKTRSITDPEYPREWVLDRDNKPRCTAWKARL